MLTLLGHRASRRDQRWHQCLTIWAQIGPLALFSSDVGLLKQEATQAGTQLKAERLALLAQHRPTAYCPPAKSGIGSDELLASLRRIPAAELARMQFKDAFRHILAQKYPCSR